MSIRSALIYFLAIILLFFIYALSSIADGLGNAAGYGLGCLSNIFFSAILLITYCIIAKKIEKREPQELAHGLCLKGTASGLAFGFLYQCIVIACIAAMGCYHIESISLSNTYFLSAILTFLTVAIGEEIIFRGILYRKLRDRFGIAWALLLSGLLFGLIHLGNDNATLWSAFAIALEAGILLGAAYEFSGSLWFPIGIHWAWNYAESIIFSSAVSGMEMPSIITAKFTGSELITGGAFGVENSIVAVIWGILATILLLSRCLRRKTAKV